MIQVILLAFISVEDNSTEVGKSLLETDREEDWDSDNGGRDNELIMRQLQN